MQQLVRSICRIAVVLVALSPVLWGGCGQEATESAGGPGSSIPITRCSSGVECPDGLRCAAELSACVAQGGPEVAVRMLMVPPVSSSAATGSVALPTDGSETATSLLEAATLHARVVPAYNPMQSLIPGRLVAETPGDAPGSVWRVESQSVDVVDPDGWPLTLKLIPHRPYMLRFFPKDETRPSQTFALNPLNPGASHLLIELPTLTGDLAYPVITGCVFDASPDRTDSESRALEGVRVIAVEVASAEGGPTHTSTSDITRIAEDGPSDCARFTLRVPARAASFSLVFESSPEMKDRLCPRFQTDPEQFPILIAGTVGEVVDAREFGVDTFPRIPLHLAVSGRQPGGSLVAVGGAELRIHSADNTFLDGATYRVQAVTSAEPATEGHWSGTLLPADYNVEVLPPPESAFATRQVSLVCDGADDVHQIELQPRTSVSVIVRGWDKAPVAGANVEAHSPVTSTGQRITVSAVTDANGQAQFPADPGTWELSVTPPAGAPYPRSLPISFEATGTASSVAVELPVPHLLEGTIVDELGEPLEGVAVEAHHEAATTPRLLGSGITDATGRFRLLVPPY